MSFLKYGKKVVAPFRNKKEALEFGKKVKKQGYTPEYRKVNKVYLVMSKPKNKR
jgi:hypothetical protein